MAAFTRTCDSKVSWTLQPRGEEMQAKCNKRRSPQDNQSVSNCSTVLEKTQEFFQICDTEDKGFITRRDMQRLLGELPLCADDLENVFDSLDADGNGYLTLDEFSSGFSEFLFGPTASASSLGTSKEQSSMQSPPEQLYQSQWEETLSGGEDDEEKHFSMLMEHLGANNVFEDPGEVRSLWTELRRDEPRLLSNFEEFLGRVTYQIKEAHQEKVEMETALKRSVHSLFYGYCFCCQYFIYIDFIRKMYTGHIPYYMLHIYLPHNKAEKVMPRVPPKKLSHTKLSCRNPKSYQCMEEGASQGPDRLFKIVLVGNSSVGKTSLLRRFCDDCFCPGTSATVGIDYSVKTLVVDNSQVALQMWDTAGQERYRSITKQFFRKADGVVVMYDITSEQTFTAVRSWLASVQEGAGEDIPVMLLGNKTDLEGQREIQFKAGEKLAKDSQLIFFECSAFSGHNVTESMVQLARILKEQEDREKEKTVILADSPSKKKSCC
uniref:EF-hand domain-containing protein n=1 Tax=Astyanax mexicanus TaxID=7994 RepID=A0A8B9KFY0_ASTMX